VGAGKAAEAAQRLARSGQSYLATGVVAGRPLSRRAQLPAILILCSWLSSRSLVAGRESNVLVSTMQILLMTQCNRSEPESENNRPEAGQSAKQEQDPVGPVSATLHDDPRTIAVFCITP
jgi:hypothetical protein